MKALRVTIGIIGGVSMLFVGIGLLAPAWVIFESSIGKIQFRAELGLLFTRVCVKRPSSPDYICSFDKVEQTSGALEMAESDAALAELLCMFLGTVSCIGALFISLRRATPSESALIAGSIFWALTALLVFIAVGLQGHQNQKLNDMAHAFHNSPSVKVDLPWALLLAGLGAFCALTNAVLMAIVCCRNWKGLPMPPVVGEWHRFQNTTVVQQ